MKAPCLPATGDFSPDWPRPLRKLFAGFDRTAAQFSRGLGIVTAIRERTKTKSDCGSPGPEQTVWNWPRRRLPGPAWSDRSDSDLPGRTDPLLSRKSSFLHDVRLISDRPHGDDKARELLSGPSAGRGESEHSGRRPGSVDHQAVPTPPRLRVSGYVSWRPRSTSECKWLTTAITNCWANSLALCPVNSWKNWSSPDNSGQRM